MYKYDIIKSLSDKSNQYINCLNCNNNETVSDIINKKNFEVKYKYKLKTFRTRLSIKNNLNDNRELIVRSINIKEKMYTKTNSAFQSATKFNSVGGYKVKGNLYIHTNDSFFYYIKTIKPTNIKSNLNLENTIDYLGDNKYIKIKNNEEITIDLEYTVQDKNPKLFCTFLDDYECQSCPICKSAIIATYDNKKFQIEIEIDKPDFDDLSEKKMIKSIINNLETGKNSIISN